MMVYYRPVFGILLFLLSYQLPSSRFRFASWHRLQQCDVTGDQLTCPRVREGLWYSKTTLICSKPMSFLTTLVYQILVHSCFIDTRLEIILKIVGTN